MDLKQFSEQFRKKMEDVNRFAKEKVPDIVGVEAVDHFKESFDREGFTDETLQKWPDVRRRDPDSEWFGFQPGNKKQFSQARTVAKILTGDTGELREAITYRKEPGKVIVSNDKPYAHVHNYGGTAKIFGKKSFLMKQRKFMGPSKTLAIKINDKIFREITNILKK